MPSKAFTTALTAAYPKLWRFCIATTGRYDTGADLAQTTSLRAMEKHRLFEPGTKFEPWIFRIAQRIWLNELRANAVRRGQGQISAEDAGLVDKNPDAVANIFHREVLDKVMGLPEAQRVTLVLVYVEGYTYEQTSKILDIPIGTVMSRLAAARAKLVRQLKTEKGSVG